MLTPIKTEQSPMPMIMTITRADLLQLVNESLLRSGQSPVPDSCSILVKDGYFGGVPLKEVIFRWRI